jgi:hypothetical protein
VKLPGVPRVIPVVGPEGGESGIGAALAAAADKDSKLSPEVSLGIEAVSDMKGMGELGNTTIEK